MSRFNARTLATVLLIFQTCAEALGILVFAWTQSLPYRISPEQEAAIRASGDWLEGAFLIAVVTGGAAALLVRSPVCRAGNLRAWWSMATLVLVLVSLVVIIAPEIHGVSHKPPDEPHRAAILALKNVTLFWFGC